MNRFLNRCQCNFNRCIEYNKRQAPIGENTVITMTAVPIMFEVPREGHHCRSPSNMNCLFWLECSNWWFCHSWYTEHYVKYWNKPWPVRWEWVGQYLSGTVPYKWPTQRSADHVNFNGEPYGTSCFGSWSGFSSLALFLVRYHSVKHGLPKRQGKSVLRIGVMALNYYAIARDRNVLSCIRILMIDVQ